MATFERLLLAILLAFAACKMSTDSLKPKTDADCAIDQKACGYKCVPKSDPTTGCGNSGCGACAATPPNTYPTCTQDFQCSYACAPGWSDCTALPGCETQVGGDDPSSCGACNRTCSIGSACIAGVCVPESYPLPDGEPRGIAYHPGSGRVFWVRDASGGDVSSVDDLWAFRQHAIGLDQRIGSPAASRVAVNTDPADTNVYATGAVSQDVAVYQIDPASPTLLAAPLWTDQPKMVREGFHELLIVGGQLFVVREAVVGPCMITPPAGSTCFTSGATAIRGLTPWASPNPTPTGLALWYGYPDGGGSLMYVDDWTMGERTFVSGFGSWPARIAVYPGGPGVQPQWFWVDESNGNVWHVPPAVSGQYFPPELLDAGSGSPTDMDIRADSQGVVWTDRRAGKIKAWRAWDGAVFDVGRGGEPRGVALTPSWIYWTDSQPGAFAIRRVPR